MDINSDTSVLSDELKPRRTPVPASFADTVPRPSVPDLSIIEIAEPSVIATLPVTSTISQPSLSHLSYNDWRQRIGGRSHHAMSLAPSYDKGLHGFKSPSVVTSVNIAGITQQKVPCRQENNQHLSSPVDSKDARVSYSYLGQRPSTAPASKSHQVEIGVGQDHPFSLSAPPLRSANQYQRPEAGQISSVQRHIAPHLGSSNLNAGSHEKGGMVPQTSYQSHSLPNAHTTCRSVISNQNSLPLASRQHLNGMYQVFPEVESDTASSVMHPMRNNFSNSNAISYVASQTSGGEQMQNLCPSECCKTVRKNSSPWPNSEPVCCSSTAAFHPHLQSHTHSVPCAVQHTFPCPQVSFDELYKIVLAQNDQLKALQTQVERLLMTQDQRAASGYTQNVKDVEKLPCSNRKFVTEEGTQTSDCESKDEESQKMSIGVMTSFVHAVTYTQKGGRIDTVRNLSEQGSHSNQSKSPSSDDCSSSSSPASKESMNISSKFCKGCSAKDKHNRKSRKQSSKVFLTLEHDKNVPLRNTTCPDSCNCNNPGVSDAITAVRGCQAVLASTAGITGHDFSTFTGAELPTVTEQQVSPMSSIHVELQEYHSSSDGGSGSSDSGEDSSFEGNESPRKDQEAGSTQNGWTFYNNVLGQVNKILEERDVASSNNQQIVPLHPQKQTDISVSKRVAFEHQDTDKKPQDLKEMAIKFLKENYPDELASNADGKKFKKPCGEKVQEMSVYNMPASNMSFATFRYLERYNLLPENFNPQQYLETATNMQGLHVKSRESNHRPLHDGGSKKHFRQSSAKSKLRSNNLPCSTVPDAHYHRQRPVISNLHTKPSSNPSPSHHPARMQPQPNTPTSKILDITTLRQQPKLL